MLYTTVDSPIDPLLLFGDGTALHGLRFAPHTIPKAWSRDDGAFAGARRQLDEYFARDRTRFELELDLEGTPFQRSVWDALLTIPYGETRSYGEIAGQIGAGPAASRAVGLANGQNPVAVIVPCHRVIGADGSLTGFGGGLPRKRLLLDLEANAFAFATQPLAATS